MKVNDKIIDTINIVGFLVFILGIVLNSSVLFVGGIMLFGCGVALDYGNQIYGRDPKDVLEGDSDMDANPDFDQESSDE